MRTFLRVLAWIVAVLVALGTLARLTALRIWVVPEDDPYLTTSLAPTLEGGDVVILWRLTAPAVGNLVVCPEPDAPERIVVARFIGEEFDRVTLRRNELVVAVDDNDGKEERAVSERACERATFMTLDPENDMEVEQRCTVEAYRGKLIPTAKEGTHPSRARVETADVEEGMIYLVSDNRLFPYDSRDFGQVPRDSCREAVVFRLWGKGGLGDVDRRLDPIP